MARESEQARERIADRPVARRRDRERAGRVGGDHLDLHALPRVCPAGTVVGAGLEDLAEDLAEPGRSQPEVDEAGAGDLGALDLHKTGRRNHQLLGQLAWRLPARGRELQRDVGGVVAVRRVARALELDRSPRELRWSAALLWLRKSSLRPRSCSRSASSSTRTISSVNTLRRFDSFASESNNPTASTTSSAARTMISPMSCMGRSNVRNSNSVMTLAV